jgi:hypothetical protein
MFHVALHRDVPSEEDLKDVPAAFINSEATDPVFLDIHYVFKRMSLHLYDFGSGDLVMEFWSHGGPLERWVPTFNYAGQMAMRQAIDEAVAKYKEENCST